MYMCHKNSSVQLFDEDNYLNQHGANHYIFTTEAHIIPLIARLRKKVWDISETQSNDDEEIDAETQTNQNELIDVNHNVVNIETDIIPIKKKRVNETSVSI